MQGKENVIAGLNELLAGELTSIDVYFVQSRVCADWGLTRLHDQFAHEMEDEKGHAGSLIERILFLGGLPDVVSRTPFKSGADVKEILEVNLSQEYEVAANLKRVIALCETEKDFVTREILNKLLWDTEQDHILWIETQLRLIERIGIQNYCQSMSSGPADIQH